MNLRTLSLTLLLAGLLGGCATLAPDYTRPAAPVDMRWPTTTTAADQPGAADIGWRDFFVDTRLHQLIDMALANNRDLRATALAIVKARAQYRIQRAELFPAVSADAGTTARRTPGELSGHGQAVTSRRHNVDLGIANWEIDLFGRLQSLRYQALETYLASVEPLPRTAI